MLPPDALDIMTLCPRGQSTESKNPHESLIPRLRQRTVPLIAFPSPFLHLPLSQHSLKSTVYVFDKVGF